MLEWSSNKCPGDEVENSTTMNGTLTNFTISDLRSDSSYSITVTASNAAGNSTSNVLTVHTPVMGKVCVANGENLILGFYSSLCPSLFCESLSGELYYHLSPVGTSGTLC